MRGDPVARLVAQRVLDAVIVDPLRQRLAQVRQRAAVREKVPVDLGVVHSVEAADGEPGGQVVGGVEAGRLGRVGQVGEARDDERAAPDQVDRLRRGHRATDEQRAAYVDAGQVHRGQVDALQRDAAKARVGQVPVEICQRLDFQHAVVDRGDDLGARRRHGVIVRWSRTKRRKPSGAPLSFLAGSWGGSGLHILRAPVAA